MSYKESALLLDKIQGKELWNMMKQKSPHMIL